MSYHGTKKGKDETQEGLLSSVTPINKSLPDGESCFSAGIPVSIARTTSGKPNKVYFRVIPYTSNMGRGRTQIKFSGGTNKKPRETPREVLERELVEELGIYNLKAELVHTSPKNSELGRGPHTQYFFVVTHWEGQFHTTQRVIRDDQVGPSWWEDVVVLENIIFRAHLPAFYAAIGYLAKDPHLCIFLDKMGLLVKDPSLFLHQR